MVVTNSAGAMILSRLFAAMWERGMTIVATSNRPPHDLYKNGLNREHFLPFIALLETKADVLPLNGPVVYRLDRLGRIDTCLGPNGPAATQDLSAAVFRLTDCPVRDRAPRPTEDIPVAGSWKIGG